MTFFAKILHIIALLTLLVAITLSVLLWIQVAIPTTFWYEQHSIVPVKESFLMREKLQFISDINYHRTTDIEWTHVLMCDLDFDDFGFSSFSSYESSAVILPQEKSVSPNATWVYNARTPDTEATCYLESASIITLPFGVHRESHIESGRFRIE